MVKLCEISEFATEEVKYITCQNSTNKEIKKIILFNIYFEFSDPTLLPISNYYSPETW